MNLLEYANYYTQTQDYYNWLTQCVDQVGFRSKKIGAIHLPCKVLRIRPKVELINGVIENREPNRLGTLLIVKTETAKAPNYRFYGRLEKLENENIRRGVHQTLNNTLAYLLPEFFSTDSEEVQIYLQFESLKQQLISARPTEYKKIKDVAASLIKYVNDYCP